MLCLLLSAAVVLPGYLSGGYDHRDPRILGSKGSKRFEVFEYLPFDLPPPVTLLLAALADGIINV